jgi:hypothetical protein
MSSKLFLKYKFHLLVLLEFFIFFYLRNKLEFIVTPILYLAVCLFVSFNFLKMNINIEQKINSFEIKKWSYVFYFTALIFFSFWANHIMIKSPVDIKTSDIIPYINDLYLKRFFNGKFVYSIAPGLGYGNWTPNYLTFHWLPFAISYYFQFDHRWVVLTVFFMTVYIYLFHFISTKSHREYWFKSSLPFLLLFNLFYNQSGSFAHTVELLIASYYFLLAMFLIKNNIVGKSIGLTLTILSRYIVIFYIPIALVIEFYLNKKQIFKQIVIVVILVSVFYVIPFMLKDSGIFFKGAESYDLAALGEWDGQHWQQPNDRPHQLFQGLGFASWAYSFLNGNLENKIHIFKIIMLFSGFVTILLSIIYFMKNKNKYSLKNWHLASLKLVITVIISFSLVPYSYLFYTNLVLSIVMLGSINDNSQTNENNINIL